MSGTRRVATEPPELGLLLEILAGHVATPRGLCVDSPEPERWDRDQLDGESRDERVERLSSAVAICGRCPEVTRCAAALHKVPPLGVPRTE